MATLPGDVQVAANAHLVEVTDACEDALADDPHDEFGERAMPREQVPGGALGHPASAVAAIIEYASSQAFAAG